MNKLKVAFFGTSDRSVPILEAIKKSDGLELALCITKNDKLVGRHREIKPTGVKVWATQHNITYLGISDLKSDNLEKIIAQLNYSKVDYCLVADFSFIIPFSLLELYKNRFINIHFSLLPLYRGASPVQHTILNGDEMAGITFLLVDKKMDSGNIIHQIGYKMSGNETSGTLYATLFELAAENVGYVLENYDTGQLKPRKQNEAQASYTYSPTHPTSTHIFKEDALIDWSKTAKEIERAIRAYCPWPSAWTELGALEINKRLENTKIKLKPTVNKKAKVKILRASLNETSLLEIKELQPEGSKPMKWEAFANGYVS